MTVFSTQMYRAYLRICLAGKTITRLAFALFSLPHALFYLGSVLDGGWCCCRWRPLRVRVRLYTPHCITHTALKTAGVGCRLVVELPLKTATWPSEAGCLRLAFGTVMTV
jgi:hypothetical protein